MKKLTNEPKLVKPVRDEKRNDRLQDNLMF